MAVVAVLVGAIHTHGLFSPATAAWAEAIGAMGAFMATFWLLIHEKQKAADRDRRQILYVLDLAGGVRFAATEIVIYAKIMTTHNLIVDFPDHDVFSQLRTAVTGRELPDWFLGAFANFDDASAHFIARAKELWPHLDPSSRSDGAIGILREAHKTVFATYDRLLVAGAPLAGRHVPEPPAKTGEAVQKIVTVFPRLKNGKRGRAQRAKVVVQAGDIESEILQSR